MKTIIIVHVESMCQINLIIITIIITYEEKKEKKSMSQFPLVKNPKRYAIFCFSKKD